MSNEDMTTVARPYALAAFEYALEKNDVSAWQTMLKNAALLVKDQSIDRLLKSPNLNFKKVADLFCDILKLSDQRKENFIRLLAENKRLLALPMISEAFEALRAQHDKTVVVQATSAVELDDSYKQKLVKALTKRLQRQVSLETNIDPNILGGVILRAGDKVFDGSVRGKLNRMIEFI